MRDTARIILRSRRLINNSRSVQRHDARHVIAGCESLRSTLSSLLSLPLRSLRPLQSHCNTVANKAVRLTLGTALREHLSRARHVAFLRDRKIWDDLSPRRRHTQNPPFTTFIEPDTTKDASTHTLAPFPATCAPL